MMDYVCHTPEGAIVSWGTCQPGHLAGHTLPGTTALEGSGTDLTHYVVKGKVCAYTPAQSQARRAFPGAGWVWSVTLATWQDTRSLQDLQVAKNNDISASRLLASQAAFIFGGKQIAMDPFIDRVHGQVLFAGTLPKNWSGSWKAMDNSLVPIADVATWGLFYQAMVDQGTTNYNRAQQLKTSVKLATKAKDLDSVVW